MNKELDTKKINTDIIDNYMTFRNDNINPSEALECLKYLSAILPYWQKENNGIDTLIIIESYILKAQEQEKALKIIFEKKVDMYMLNDLGTLEEYNEWVLKKYGTYYQLTKEEFELLKRYAND